MNKFCGLSSMKVGSHILRSVWGILNMPSLKRYSGDGLKVDQNNWEESRFIIGHCSRGEDVEDLLQKQNRRLWLTIRDPRDITVAMWYWMKDHKENPQSYEWCIKRTARQGKLIVKWEDYEGVEIFRFEDMILHPEETALRMSEIMDTDYKETLKRLLFRGGLTYRKGEVGNYKHEFPEELWELYEEECKEIKHWEWDAAS